MQWVLRVSLSGIIVLCSFFIQIYAQKTLNPDPNSAGIEEKTPDQETEEGDNWKLKRGATEIGFEAGFAPMQPTFLSGRKEYDTAGRKFAMGSFRLGRVIGTKGPVTYEYLFQIIPVSFAIKNEIKNPKYISDAKTPNVPKTIRENTYGFGIKPANFRFLFLPEKRLKPYVQVGAGFIFTKKPVPIPESPNYNFIGDFGGGLMYSVKRKQTVSFGYRYFHISNMNIGAMNPGYNANIFYIGYSFFSK